MICKKCGTENDDNELFCTACQASLKDDEPAAQPETDEAAPSSQEEITPDSDQESSTETLQSNECSEDNTDTDLEQSYEAIAEPEQGSIKSKASMIVVICVIAAALLALIAGGVLYFVNNSKTADEKAKEKMYSGDYLPVYGETLGEIADSSGFSLEEFIDFYHLPKDMPASTDMYAAQMAMKVKDALNFGDNEEDIQSNAQSMKEELGLENDIDPNETLGKFLDSLTLRQYLNVAYAQYLAYGMDIDTLFAQFKEVYEFGDDVTLDTIWKDIRKQYEEKSIALREEAENPTEEPTENATEDNSQADGE